MGKHAKDDAAALRLWDVSEQILAGAGFPLS
jgi:hypothetical protein